MLADEAILQLTEFLVMMNRSRKTIIGYQSDLRNFARFCEHKYNGPWYVEDTTTQDVEEFLVHLQTERQLNPATRNRILCALKSFFRYLQRQGIRHDNPAESIDSIRHPRPERMCLREEEVHRFIEHIDHPLIRLVATTLAYTGLRISECVQLRIQDVNFTQRTIFVASGKGNKSRTLPIADKLYGELLAYYQENRQGVAPEEKFFATEATGQLSASHVNRILHQTSERLGLKKPVTAHVFRHSFATNLIRRGVSLVHVQKLLGHSSLAVTSVYTHATLEDLVQAVNRL